MPVVIGRPISRRDAQVVFAHHHVVHEQLGRLFGAKLPRSAWVHVTGRTPAAERVGSLKRFVEDPACRFAVLALSACGVGLNLAVADTAVFTELCWTPSMLEQAEARIHRMGQTASHCSIYYLMAGDGSESPDGAMFGALVNKQRAAHAVVDGGVLPSDLSATGTVSAPPRRAEADAGASDGPSGSSSGAGPSSPPGTGPSSSGDATVQRRRLKRTREIEAAEENPEGAGVIDLTSGEEGDGRRLIFGGAELVD